MSVRERVILFNARPYPGPLPRGAGESFSVSLAKPLLDLRGAKTRCRERSQPIPSPGGEGQGEGGCDTIPFFDSNARSETPHFVCYN